MRYRLNVPVSKIVILDAVGSERIKALLQLQDALTVCTRFEEIFLPSAIAAIIKKFLFRGVGTLQELYLESVLLKAKPETVYSSIDNSVTYFNIAIKHKNMNFVFLQNGIKSRLFDLPEMLRLAEKPGNVIILVFGPYSAMVFEEIVGFETLSIGIGHAGHWNSEAVIPDGESGLCLISQYRHASQCRTEAELAYHQIFELVARNTATWALDRGLRFCAVGCALESNQAEERDFFESLGYEYCPRVGHSSYHNVEKTYMTVSVDSTLGLEAALHGSRVAFAPVRARIVGDDFLTFGLGDLEQWQNFIALTIEQLEEVLDQVWGASAQTISEFNQAISRLHSEGITVYPEDLNSQIVKHFKKMGIGT